MPAVTAIPAIPEEVEVVEAAKDFIFNANHRCDRCGAQAYVMVTLKSDLELYFCAHHARRWEPGLKAAAKSWYTEEARLQENRKQGSEN